MSLKSLSWGAIALLAMGLPAAAASAATVVVNINGVRNASGMVLAQLCDNAIGYPEAPCKIGVITPAAEGRVRVVFGDVAPGIYAFEAFHDEDGDYLFSLPTEGYAFSNGAAPPKTFDEASFAVTGDMRQTVTMTYKTAE